MFNLFYNKISCFFRCHFRIKLFIVLWMFLCQFTHTFLYLLGCFPCSLGYFFCHESFFTKIADNMKC